MSESPASLHRLAHRAVARQRHDDGSWGAPVVTALAAVAMAEHPPAYRATGAEALDALDRWVSDMQPRRVSGDVAAVCLGARAAAAYGRSDNRKAADAAERAADMAGRAVSPPLHLALACWALDPLVPDRRAEPWVSFRGMPKRRAVGTDRALMVYVEHIAAESFNAAGLVRELTASGAGLLRPGLEDGAVLLWLLTAVIDKATPYLADDNALHALVDQRADLVARLALELGEGSFVALDWSDGVHNGRGDGPYLSPIEALLIDMALSSPEREESWLTYDEARALFGQEAADERRGTRRWRSSFAAALSLAGLVGGAFVWAVARFAQASSAEVSWWAAAAVFFAFAAVASVLGRRRTDHDAFSKSLAAAVVTAAVASALLLVNSLLPTPLLTDAASVFVGVVVPVAAAVIAAAVTRPK